MAESIEIFWHGKSIPELEPKIEKELIEMLSSGLKCASSLIFHSFFLGDKEKDPVVIIWGEENDHRFHAEYKENHPPEMIFSFDDIGEDAPLMKAIRKKEKEEEEKNE